MKLNAISLALLLSSCSLSPTAKQESEDFLTIVNNSRLNTNSGNEVVHAIVLQWTPEVIHAIAGYRARQLHWTPDTTESYVRELVEEHYGVAGDSTLFLISLENTQYPCTPPMLILPQKMIPLIPPSMMPCENIDIQDIHNRIYLQNERGVKLHPLFVAGRKNRTLTTEELLWAKFQVGLGGYNWMNSSQELYLIIDIKPQTIKLKIK